MKPHRVVLDTNILISAFIFGGNPEKLFQEARESGIRLLTSGSILREFASILRGKFDWDPADVVEALSAIAYSAELVEPSIRLHIIKDDPDNRILECAVEGNADFIVSGDRHLLTLKKYNNIRIVNSKQLLELLEKRRQD